MINDESYYTLLGKEEKITLEECFDEFVKEIKVEDCDNDGIYCTHCKKYVTGDKKFDVYSLPNLLVISLNRLIRIEKELIRDDTLVDFPLTLSLEKFVLSDNQKDFVYDLFAVNVCFLFFILHFIIYLSILFFKF